MALCRRISYLYALALLTVYALFLPLGGYERMMEGKYRAFLLLSLGYVLAMTALGAWKAVRWREPMCLAALAYLALTALSAALSPYGTAVLLGGTRRDGLLTAALYIAVFLLLARHLRPDRRLLYAAAVSAALCDLLVLVQLTGRNPLWLYPAGLNYFDGDVAYSGFYAGAAGNIDFTAFLLALCAAAMAAAEARWLTMSTVLPSRFSASARSTAASFRLSRFDVGSSNSTNGASCRNTRARPMRCRSPPESVSPSSPTGVSSPRGRRSIKPLNAALRHASASSSGEALGFARRMFSPMVPANRCVSCVM